MNIFKTNVMGTCPGGFCDYIQSYSEVLVVILCLDGFIFFVTLLPPLFNWSSKKADGRKRIYFAALACLTFYFWLAFLAVNSLYCFGFLAHQGPCKATGPTSSTTPSVRILANITQQQQQSSSMMTSTTALPTLATENIIEKPKASASTNSMETPLPTLLASTSSFTSSMLPTKYSSTLLSSLQPKTVEISDSASVFSTVEATHAASENSAANVVIVENHLPTKMTNEEEILVKSSTVAKAVGVPMALISWTSTSDKSNNSSSCVQMANEHETQLKNLTLVNVLILVVLFIVFIANAREAMTAKALYHKETLCKREEVQRFLSSLVLKPPEVGHFINCFHMAKTNTDTRNKKANMAATAANLSKKSLDGGPPRKVITFSAIENFAYQTWRDFSDLRLIEPSPAYPIIEIEVMLNFFPGDHYTAEKYKAFVNEMTKTHSGKDARITIDDYFHVEDHREWTFFIGNEDYIAPWWDCDAAKIPLSCILLLGWPFRLAYGGHIAKHQVEIKKAVFVENNSAADEGVSLSATPASEDNAANNPTEASSSSKKNAPSVFVQINHKKDNKEDEILDEDEEDNNNEFDVDETQAMLEASVKAVVQPTVISTASSINETFTEHRVNAVVSQPPKENYSDHQYFYQQMQVGPSMPTTRVVKQVPIPAFGHPLANVLPASHQPQQQPPPLPTRQMQQPSSRRALRTLVEQKQDVVTQATVVTHQDINGVNTVAMKDLDVQMSAMSGYETYV